MSYDITATMFAPLAMPTRTFYSRRWNSRPRAPPPTPVDNQFKQLLDAVTKLALSRPVPAMLPVRPPNRRKRRSRPQKQKPPQTKASTPKQKQNTKAPANKPAKKKPGKRERACMKIESDCIFPVKLDGLITGYACLVGDKVMKPAHVQGTIDNPILAKLNFKRSSKYDMESAPVPTIMRSDAAKFTCEKPEGYYNWHNGAVQYSDGRFTIPTGAGKPGDSGRPIFDNKGRVVAIVLGGANEGERTALSVVTWNKNTVVKVTPEETVEWSALTLLCILGNVTFPCDSPPCAPCCYENNPENTLKMLELNADRPGYDELLQAALRCNGRRGKRSVASSLLTYRTTQPYVARCDSCGIKPCNSPIAIENIQSMASDGTIRIQVSAHLKLNKVQVYDDKKISYMYASNIEEANLYTLYVRTTHKCQLLDSGGYFIIAKCPEGNELEVGFTGKYPHSCRTTFSHKHRFLGRERTRKSTIGGKQVACTTYAAVDNREQLPVHMPPDIPDDELLTSSAGKPVIKIHPTMKTRYHCQCKEGDKDAVVTTQTTVEGCTEYHCKTWISQHTKWQYNSRFVPRAEEKEPKAYITVPFAVVNTTCYLPQAAKPVTKFEHRRLIITVSSPHESLLTVRSLGDRSIRYHHWHSGTTTLNFTLPRSGLEYRWGNNEPVRVWGQHSSQWDPHGLPHSVFLYYLDKHPLLTASVITVTALLTVIGFALAAWLICSARNKCLTPYALTPNAQVPTIIAFLCCIRRAAAETTFDSLSHLWSHNYTLFWLQLLVPVAGMIVLCSVCKCMFSCCKQICFLSCAGCECGSGSCLRTHRCHAKQSGVPV
ncbi:truncated polyprotein [Southern elephant seal virus]|uniref:truncated polyprotein n=2 Tax=Southern elephant seal virus TaxID=1159195 RepID=UPI000269B370|nr:truncated polyprotein [Southern elephant seal virus]